MLDSKAEDVYAIINDMLGPISERINVFICHNVDAVPIDLRSILHSPRVSLIVHHGRPDMDAVHLLSGTASSNDTEPMLVRKLIGDHNRKRDLEVFGKM